MRTASLLHALPLLAAPAAGQSLMVYSLDYHGPLIGTEASGSTDKVTEADLLDAMLILQQGLQARQGGNAMAEEEMLKLMLAELMRRERA